MNYSLRPYQLNKVAEARAMMGSGKKSICLVSPCGSGKTVIAAHIILSALSKCRRVLFLAHRRELINQCADKLKALGVLDYNVILPRHPQSNNPTSQMHIASIQTLIRREYPKADLIIVDECHHAVGRQYQSLLSNYPNSYVLGLTATPERLDGKGLDDIFQDLLEVATVPQLIEQGFLVKPTCLSPSIEMAEKIKESLSGLKIRGGDYDEGELGDAMDNKVLIGDIIEHWKEWAFGQKTIVFAASILHSQHIVEQFTNAGIAAAHIDGKMGTKERERILSAWRTPALDVVSNCQILTEGFDYPELSCCIQARPTKSLALHLQMVGRIMRVANGKNGAIILDHAGNILEHGVPHAERIWDLKGSAKKSKSEKPHACFMPGCGAMFVESDAGAILWIAEDQTGIIENYRFIARKFENMDAGSIETKLIVCPLCHHASCKFCGEFIHDQVHTGDLVCENCRGVYVRSKPVQEGKAGRELPECADGTLELVDEVGEVNDKIVVKNEYHRLMNVAGKKGFNRGWVWHRLTEKFSEDQLRCLPRHPRGWWKQPASEQ